MWKNTSLVTLLNSIDFSMIGCSIVGIPALLSSRKHPNIGQALCISYKSNPFTDHSTTTFLEETSHISHMLEWDWTWLGAKEWRVHKLTAFRKYGFKDLEVPLKKLDRSRDKSLQAAYLTTKQISLSRCSPHSLPLDISITDETKVYTDYGKCQELACIIHWTVKEFCIQSHTWHLAFFKSQWFWNINTILGNKDWYIQHYLK